jgi:hypothetical protein
MAQRRKRTHRTVGIAGGATLLLAAAAACVFVMVAAAVVFVHRTVRTTPTGTEETVGGLHYSVDNAWILNPDRKVDAQVAKGLPVAARRANRRQLLYAVFVGVTNETDRGLRMAKDIELRDVLNREYAPLPLGRENAYAYRPRVVEPQTHRPAQWTAPGRDLSAVGSMLVFRIPRQAYAGGPLELVVHDPAHPDSVRTIQVA